MRRSLISALLFVLANGAGLLLASILVPNFSISIPALIFAALLLSIAEIILGPLILKLSRKRAPALEGGIALVTTFVGLFLTSLFIDGMRLGGPLSWVMASLLVWLGALIAGIILPRYLFKSTNDQ